MSSKRRASTSGNRDAEKLAKKMKSQSDDVTQALKSASLPSEAKAMLLQGVPHSLTTFADERHSYQKSMVQMASESLSGVENTLVANVVAAKQKVDSFDQHQMEMAIPQQARANAPLIGTAASKWADTISAKMTLQQAGGPLKAALKEQKAGDADYNAAAAKSEKLNAAKAQLESMKAEVPSKQAVAKLQSHLREFDVEEALLGSLGGVLCRPASEQGDFEAMTLGQLNDKLAVKTQETAAGLAQLEPGKAQRAAAVAAAQGVHDAAKEKLDNANAALKAAESAVKDGEQALKTAEKSLHNFAGALKSAESHLKQEEGALAAFRSGPLEAFKFLESCNTPPPPPEPEPVAEPEDPSAAAPEA